MSSKVFTDQEVKELRKNPNVKRVSHLGITYTEKFKLHFIEENQKGKWPRLIFEECGFDIDVLGKHRINSSADRWRLADKRREGLRDMRKGSSGRPRIKPMTQEQFITKLKAENEYLTQELKFRQELERLERQVMREKKSGRNRNMKSSKD